VGEEGARGVHERRVLGQGGVGLGVRGSDGGGQPTSGQQRLRCRFAGAWSCRCSGSAMERCWSGTEVA